jgi:molybdopterin molybdotransferase
MFGDGAGSFVRATHEAEPFANSHVRPSGDEAKRDEILVPAGTRLSPAHTALAAMAGYDTLEVRCAVSCEILVLGDEVLRSGIPRSGQVRDAFEPQFAAYAALLGLEVTGFRFIPDTLEATTEALATSTARVVISTGGTAAGPKDFLHSALTSVGAQMVIDSIAMRPGHPNLLAQRGNQFFVGLPGNPLSASLGGMLTLVRPLACGLLGMPLPELTSALTSTPFKAPAHDTRLVPVTVENRSGTIFVTELPWLNSGMMRGLANADAVAVIPPGGVGEQEVVEVLALAW